jgi:1-phosphofructokinase
MIVTLTPNPSLDRTVEVDELVRGAVLRVTAAHVEPAGKGVNVARALARSGHKVRAVLPAGGAEGVELAALLAGEGLDTTLVPVHGAVRTNVSVVEPDGTVTKLNEPGPELRAAELDALVTATAAAAGHADWVALSGSLPPGAPDDFYARVVAQLRGSARVAVDSSGPALVAALAAGPALIKPNREELAEATGREIRTLRDAIGAAEELRRRGAGAVLVSLGPDGALLVDAGGAVHGEAAAVRRSTVGAGDALLAGFLAGALNDPGTTALAEALAWGAAAVSLPGSRMPGPADLDRTAVRLHADLDLDLVLDHRS